MSYSAVRQLVEDHVEEGPRLDFKSQPYWSPKTPAAVVKERRLELCKDVTSFANGEGGSVIIGVEEDGHSRASALKPFDDLGQHEMAIANVLDRYVVPKLSGAALNVRTLEGRRNTNRGLIVISVGPAAPGRPHAIDNEGLLEFWVRQGKSKRPMTYQQVAHSFSEDEAAQEQRQIDAIAKREVLRIEQEIAGADWDSIHGAFERLHPYAHEFHFGISVKEAVLDAVSAGFEHAGFGLPAGTAATGLQLLSEILPIWSLRGCGQDPLTEREFRIIERAANEAITLMYQASRRLHDSTVLNLAGQLVWKLLRFAELNEAKAFKAKLLQDLDERIEWAKKDDLPIAARLLEFYRADALDAAEEREYEVDLEVRRFIFSAKEVKERSDQPHRT